jgi:hypothetical protein
MALVPAAFCKVVEHWFTRHDPPDRVIEFVAHVRASFGQDAGSPTFPAWRRRASVSRSAGLARSARSAF